MDKKEQMVKQIKEAIKNTNLMSVRKPLEKAGFKVDSALSPIPYITATKHNIKFVLCKKRYAEGALEIVEEIAIGVMD